MDRQEAELAALEKRIAAPGFWDKSEEAARVMGELSTVKHTVQGWAALRERTDDLRDFVSLARERGFDPAALAVAWTMSHPAVTCPIIGARKVEQLDAYLQALQIDMSDDLYQEISALTPPPPVATDRSEELYGPIKIPKKV